MGLRCTPCSSRSMALACWTHPISPSSTSATGAGCASYSKQRRPQVIFHAAALKHLTLLERYPEEALKTNVWGSLNLLEESAAHGVERFVNISTDKAADPISVLGYTKRLAERLTAHVAATPKAST